jgi:peptidyl-prolyl cis-trans isomerase D
MFEKFRKNISANPGRNTSPVKKWMAILIFGAIIAVFALFGINSDQYGQTSGGVAATVNDESISINDFRQAVEAREQQLRQTMNQLPEQQRRMASDRMRGEALEELIQMEIYHQQARRMGIVVPDGRIQDMILSSPFLQENGRFKRERYDMLLQSRGVNGAQFETGLRKQIMIQTMQNLFVGAATPTQEEVRRNRLLANQKVNLRFAEVAKSDLANPAFVSGAEVQDYLNKNKAEIEKYYNDNKIEFTSNGKVKTRHILLRPNEKRDDAATAKEIAELKKQATPANFASLASKHSEDPGSKAKGGELPEFERNGGMVAEFASAAFETPEGKISEPVKTQFGYHLILVEKKTESRTAPLAEVQTKIASQLIARSKEAEITGNFKKMVESGNKREVEGLLSRAGLKWQDTGEFDLSTSFIPKLGPNPEVIGAVVKRGKAGGFIPQLINNDRGYVVAEVTSWKEGAPVADVEGMDRMVAFRKANELIEEWNKETSKKFRVERNYRLVPPPEPVSAQ